LDLRNVGILPQHYTASKVKRLELERLTHNREIVSVRLSFEYHRTPEQVSLEFSIWSPSVFREVFSRKKFAYNRVSLSDVSKRKQSDCPR
jgi:hypothetical protein